MNNASKICILYQCSLEMIRAFLDQSKLRPRAQCLWTRVTTVGILLSHPVKTRPTLILFTEPHHVEYNCDSRIVLR